MSDKRRTAPRCKSGIRHWFTWRGWVGSSAPVCQHYGCEEPNPNYDPDRDPFSTDAHKASTNEG